jgi:hypothetical protein
MLTVTNSRGRIGGVVLLLFTVAAAAYAEDTQFASQTDRLEQLEAHYAALSSRVSQLATPSSASPAHRSVNRSWGLTGGASLVYAKPWFSGNIAYQSAFTPVTLTTTTTPTFEHGFQPAPRFWIGYQNACGGGIRARYWRFDSDDTVVSPLDAGIETAYTTALGVAGTDLVESVETNEDSGIIAEQEMKLAVIDLEYTRQFRGSAGSCTLSGGIRYARYQQAFEANFPTDFNVFQSSEFDLEGLGPTAALEGSLPVGWCCLDLYGSGRASILLAQFDQSVRSVTGGDFGDLILSDDRDHAVGVFEGEIGARWRRHLPGGATLFAQGSLEAQLWTETAPSLGELTNLGFFGVGIGVGVSR